MIIEIAQAFTQFVNTILPAAFWIMILYVVYKVVRVVDIIDIVKKGYEIEAKVNLMLAEKLAEKYGIKTAEEPKMTRREKLEARLKEKK